MMDLMQACATVAQEREPNSLLVATMGAMRAFDLLEASEQTRCSAPPGSRLSSVPLMGGAAGLGLGLALGCPERSVIVVDGDASLLMELSGLVTVAQAAPARLLHVVIHNGAQFTGLANLDSPAGGFSFADAARNAGYAHAVCMDSAQAWQDSFADLARRTGPVLVELRVRPAAAAAGDGYLQTELPDNQFLRMGQEAAAMQALLQEVAA